MFDKLTFKRQLSFQPIFLSKTLSLSRLLDLSLLQINISLYKYLSLW